jgi:hypothetical protein
MKQGDVIETDENYEKKWAGKFVETLKPVTDFDEEKVEVQVRDKKSKLVNKQTPVDEADAQVPEESVEEADDTEEDDHAEEETDVTEKYEAAGKKGLTVTKAGREYTIKDAKGKTVAEGLKRSEVPAALKKYRK